MYVKICAYIYNVLLYVTMLLSRLAMSSLGREGGLHFCARKRLESSKFPSSTL